MLELRLRALPRVRAVWFAESVGAEDLRGGPLDAQVHFQQVRHQPADPVARHAEVHAFHTLLLDLEQPDDELWAGIQKKTRGYIRGAQKVPHEIVRVKGAAAGDVVRFVAEFRAARGLGSSRPGVYDAYLANGLATAVIVDGAFVVAHVYVIDAGSSRARLLWSARALDTALDTSSLNKLLHWDDILHLKRELAVSTYDWGGVALGDDELAGVDSFKRKFGGRLVTEYNVTWTAPAYGWLERLRGSRATAGARPST